jgi:uncharacterized alkaline shock family protein YloU
MRIYALYGTSGTGKSSSALELAHRLNIEAIIDDGILVYQGRKIAGTSAKYEKTRIQAVKRAIFYYQDHADEVRGTIERLNLDRLLILGTSRKMIRRIIETLRLPSTVEYIPIETIKPAREIEAARYIRETQGKHVIPIPRVEVEKDLFQRLIASAQKILSPKKEVIGETTVVHPTFSGGRIQIHEQVLRKIVSAACYRFPEIVRVHKTVYTFHDLPRITVSITLRLPFGASILPVIRELQEVLYEEVGYCLNIAPASIDVQILSLQILTESQA